ncbi:DUF4302 domain-containing protein [Cognatitamlana onchidii]|uniref:DUF4302 domain-containing protein n=1 Tax=Cognatitamlana onchidii TaxID=2562860 RepID=UPI0010A68C93|nr:DUF4302 domain-containing protein [Algibacter onchidii]
MNRKLKYIRLIILLLLVVYSCNNDNGEDLFSASPAERIAQGNAEVLNLLISEPQGYKADYFTKNDEFGGFTFYLKFNSDGTVGMTSDFDSETSIQSSSFEIRLGTTTELVFTTRNHIQKVSDPLAEGLIGTGFKGTSVFQYFGSEEGALIFRDVRNKDTGFMKLTPSGFSNFETQSIEKVEASLEQRENILPTVNSSVFQLLTVENANGLSNFDFNYDALRLFSKPQITLSDGNIQEYSFGLNFNESGFIISPAFQYEGEIYETFVYDDSTNSFVSQVNGTTATVYYSDTPSFFKDDVNGLGALGRQTFISFLEDGTSPLTSPGFNALLDTLESNVNQIVGFENWNYLGYAYLAVPNATGDVRVDLFFENPNNPDPERAIYLFTPTVQNNRLFLRFTGVTNQTGFDLFEALVPMIQFWASPEGIYYVDEGTFTSDIAEYGNSAATFTSLSQSNLRTYGLWIN